MLTRREAVLVPLAVLAGVAIAYMDTRPTWDDTGITATLLAFAHSGRRYWGPAARGSGRCSSGSGRRS